MPYLGKAPFTISSIQPLVPGLIIDTITKEEVIPQDAAADPDKVSTVQIATLRVSDVRGNSLEFVTKRSKQRPHNAAVASPTFARDLSERLNECNFYLHYSDFFHTAGVTVPKAWSIKVPPPPNPNRRESTSTAAATSITMLLSNLKASSASFRGSSGVKLDYFQTVACLTYLAEFHAVHWESKESESSLFSFGGHGGSDYDLTSGGESSGGSWGEVGSKLIEMRVPLRRRLNDSLTRSRRHRTVIHGSFESSNLIFFPSSNPHPTISSTDFKLSGLGYGVWDVASLLSTSTSPNILTHDQKEDEFIEAYFQHLSQTLRSLKKPPLPPGYNLKACKKMYQLCLLEYSCNKVCSDSVGIFEYANWRCRQIIDEIEVGSEAYDSESYGTAINNYFPLT
ncbi:hypothetical protein TrST_g1663 [Triparma strigata]|uniref:Aminoglycoside phosphotransferase domain-containing protein n=1 Tax=Triparma strigata TaxID=1606541 RepID=A0A9W7BI37_9STRA|nr:hypothetical protein TrST_g1663 [Triparma strigata]